MYRTIKKYLYGLMVALMTVTAFALVSCSDDDDDNGGNGGTASGSEKLTVNGVEWRSNANYPPLYTGDLNEDVYSNYVSCSFTRNDSPNVLYCSSLSFEIQMNIGSYITKGMDIATADLVWGGGRNEWDLCEGVLGTDSYMEGIYGGSNKVKSGSAIVQDFKDQSFLTIKFSNFTLEKNDGAVYYDDEAPETLVLDGTVTFTYGDSTWDW